ncbi:hypothetical protein B0J11DRAFT_435119 [Dendryphion nanum]|uniref:Uncharacterized protein n=1 Tax=Dendryphion nanum TaxID=256645 RepID=A0A9P9INK1_9PLEO|nr:hypothetical protein B0J11DRAFT_435119 [Dendryphion nanum]
MATFTKDQPEPEAVTPLDIIFSCGVCNATFSEVYNGQCDSVQGLSDGINPKDRIVTRLWLTSCCHVTCSKHLPDGAPPFHSAKSRPRAPCPVCSKEFNDNEPRDLYSLRGLKKGEFDAAIPECWFVTPPIQLDAKGKENEALRFQYLALIRYSKQVHGENLQAKRELDELKCDNRKLQDLAKEERAKVVQLQQDVHQLRGVESEWKKFKSRRPAIEHYLKVIPKLVEQNEQMRQRLANLGFQMPFEPLSCNGQKYHDDDFRAPPTPDQLNAFFNETNSASSQTAGRPHSYSRPEDGSLFESPHARSLKRRRVESSVLERNNHTQTRQQKRPVNSRDLMPPPSKPLSRMRSIKKLWPTLRRKAHDRSSPRQRCTDSVELDVEMFDEAEKSNSHQSETHYMTGGLPEGQSLSDISPQQDSPHSITPNEIQSGFLFRPKFQPDLPSHKLLPSESSYMHIMDGLSHGNGLELGLRDPRKQSSSRHQSNQDNVSRGMPRNDDHNAPTISSRWNLDHAFIHQSLRGVTSISRNPTESSMPNIVDACYLQPVEKNNVVSPFFSRQSRGLQMLSSGKGVGAERQHSSRHLEASHYQKTPPTRTQPDWREPRSLNGLSFINPLSDFKNRSPVHDTAQLRRRTSYKPSHEMDARGLFKRADIERSPFLNDSAYGSDDMPSQPRPVYQQVSPVRKVPRLSSAMPASSSLRYNLKSSKTSWQSLSQAGIRTSQSSRDLFSSAGRRVVRR